MSCKFCESFEFEKQIHNDPRLKQAYNVALVIHQWRADRPKSTAGRTVDYRHKGLGYKLKYCPECGINLRNKKKVEEV